VVAAWVTIYLRDRVAELSLVALQRDLAGQPDWHMLAETFEIEDDEVDAVIDHLVWSDEPLEIRLENRRPLQFHVWSAPDRVREEVAELDQIAGAPSIPPSVRAHLASIQSIIAIEMGSSQLETMFEIVAFEVAYYLAQQHRGLIRGPNDAWFDHAQHRWDPITT
jgi:hypothetical protein